VRPAFIILACVAMLWAGHAMRARPHDFWGIAWGCFPSKGSNCPPHVIGRICADNDTRSISERDCVCVVQDDQGRCQQAKP
jgi:hypothetical protein